MLSTSYLRVSRSIISTTSWEYRSFKQRRTDVPRGGMTGGAGCQTVRGPVKPRRASGSARRESCRLGGGDGGGRSGPRSAWHGGRGRGDRGRRTDGRIDCVASGGAHTGPRHRGAGSAPPRQRRERAQRRPGAALGERRVDRRSGAGTA